VDELDDTVFSAAFPIDILPGLACLPEARA